MFVNANNKAAVANVIKEAALSGLKSDFVLEQLHDGNTSLLQNVIVTAANKGLGPNHMNAIFSTEEYGYEKVSLKQMDKVLQNKGLSKDMLLKGIFQNKKAHEYFKRFENALAVHAEINALAVHAEINTPDTDLTSKSKEHMESEAVITEMLGGAGVNAGKAVEEDTSKIADNARNKGGKYLFRRITQALRDDNLKKKPAPKSTRQNITPGRVT